MVAQEVIGFFAGALTTVAFLPQVIKVYRRKSASDISWIMMLLFITGVVLWIVYGLLIQKSPIVIANIVTFSLSMAIIILKLYYDRKNKG